VSLGKGLQAGFTADQAREAKIAERTAKAGEKELDRAEKRFANLLKLKTAQIKTRMPEVTDPEEREARAYYEVLSLMSPRELAAQGLTLQDVRQAKTAVSAGKVDTSGFKVREKT
jgi:hypothetical protein